MADALEVARIPYAIGGAIAYGLYGPPRATNDVGLNVFVTADEIEPVLDVLGSVGELEPEQAKRSARERGDFAVRVSGM